MTDRPANPKRPEPLSPTTQAVLSLVQGLLPAMTAIIGGLWIVFTYMQHQKEARDEAFEQAKASTQLANKELRYKLYEIYRPMFEKRDTDHYAMAQSVAKLLSNDVSSAEWNNARATFWEVYWGISVLGLEPLHERAKQFGEIIEKYKISQDKETREALEKAAAELRPELTRWISKEKVEFLKHILSAPTEGEAISDSETKM